MELLLSSPTTILVLAIFIYFIILIAKISNRKSIKNKPLAPEAGCAWPVIGHLHLLGGPEVPHKTFAAMAEKFGPIFLLRVGLKPTIVVNNWELAKECFTTNDFVFVNRPRSKAAELMGYNYAMFGFSPYGPYWREIRKIVTLELLSNRRLELLKHIRQSEVKTSIKEIYDKWSKHKGDCGSDKLVVVEMKKWFGDLSFNIMVRMIVGKRYFAENEEGVKFQKTISEFFRLLGVFVVSDSIPFLWWLDLGGYVKAMKKTAKDLDTILQRWLDEHKQNKNSKEVIQKEPDFMDVMLSIFKGLPDIESQSSYDNDTIVKSTCLAALMGGIDSTTITLSRTLSLLLNHPQALKRAQEELDLCVGKGRQVVESDILNLVYLQATIKETLRFYPTAPVSVPRESVEDCTVGGYHISKGTRLIFNVWKIQRDPGIWTDPDVFRPERFLTTHKEVDVRGQHFEFVPFGSGRRFCPGISLALQLTQLTLASLLHGFNLETMSEEPVDMSESFGLSNIKATPLEVLVTPRLSSTSFE